MKSIVVCNNEESAVFNCPLNNAWPVFRDLDLSAILPNSVRRCSLLIPPGDLATKTASGLECVHMLGVSYQKLPMCQGLSGFQCPTGVGSLRFVE